MQLKWAENMLSFGTASKVFFAINIYSAIQSLLSDYFAINHLIVVGMLNKYIPSQNNTVLYSHVFIHFRMKG